MFLPSAPQFPAYTAAWGRVRGWQPHQVLPHAPFQWLPITCGTQSQIPFSETSPPDRPKPVLGGPATVSGRYADTDHGCGRLHPGGHMLFSLGSSTGEPGSPVVHTKARFPRRVCSWYLSCQKPVTQGWAEGWACPCTRARVSAHFCGCSLAGESHHLFWERVWEGSRRCGVDVAWIPGRAVGTLCDTAEGLREHGLTRLGLL